MSSAQNTDSFGGLSDASYDSELVALPNLTVVAQCRRDLFSSMLPKYETLLKEDLEILVYSGDVVSS